MTRYERLWFVRKNWKVTLCKLNFTKKFLTYGVKIPILLLGKEQPLTSEVTMLKRRFTTRKPFLPWDSPFELTEFEEWEKYLIGRLEIVGVTKEDYLRNVDEEERQHLFREYTIEDAFNKIMDLHT